MHEAGFGNIGYTIKNNREDNFSMINDPSIDIDLVNGLPLEDFLRLSQIHPFELIKGRRIDKVSSVFIHSEIIQKIFILLYTYLTQHQLGRVYQETTYTLSDTTHPNWVTGSRIPDVMVYTQARFASYIANTPDYQTKPFTIVPDLIIEVLSPNDLFLDVEAKIISDFDNGVKDVWLINPIHRIAWAYTVDNLSPQRFNSHGELTVPAILPNFRLKLSDLWG